MGSKPPADPAYPGVLQKICAKVVIAGPLAVGKTSMIRALSEIKPLTTEETMTRAAADADSLADVQDKTTTTVASDFGRRTLDDKDGGLVLYLYGTPGQKRFRPLWRDISRGALGALVLVDSRRLGDSFEVMDMIEEQGLSYAVAFNKFPDSPDFHVDALRDALDLAPATPLVTCDARDTASSLDALIALVEHLLADPSIPEGSPC
ncbi:ATP/GTP-binding protein [Streptomyces niveus]|uniref:GTP-binding protein n=1 Tax=Streptomyces niveus TaxID=193462 RepID=UPI003651EB40